MTNTENTPDSPPIRSRAAARQTIREQLEKQAHAAGYNSHAEHAQAEYEDWQEVAGITYPIVIEKYSVPIDPQDELQCDSCQ